MFQTVLTFRPRMLSVFPPQKKSGLNSAFSLILRRNIKIFSASCRCVLFFPYIRDSESLLIRGKGYSYQMGKFSHTMMIKHFIHLQKQKKKEANATHRSATSHHLCFAECSQNNIGSH